MKKMILRGKLGPGHMKRLIRAALYAFYDANNDDYDLFAVLKHIKTRIEIYLICFLECKWNME